MTHANPSMGEASFRRREREQDSEATLDPDAEPDGGNDERIKVGVRRISAGRCIVGIEFDLALEAAEPGAEDGGAELLAYSLEADDVEAMLSTPARRALTPMAATAPQPRPRPRWKFDRKRFFQSYAASFSRLDQRQTAGLQALLSAAEADPQITDIRWLAYMLATVQHECAGTWRPIEEYGKGAGRPYGRPVIVTDPQGKKYRNVYYGRGYVQLTWKNNYQRMGKLLHNRLLYNPAQALQPTVAYRIMSMGMRRGLFTGKKLADYLHGKKADYVNARRIINGLDQAQKLARNAAKLEKILRRSAVRPAGDPPN